MEILGLIDAIEATILDSPRLPFSDKVVIQEKKILEMLAKLRFVAQSGEEVARQTVQGLPAASRKNSSAQPALSEASQKTIQTAVEEARVKAETMKQEADAYAVDILNQLLIVTTKIQRTIDNGKSKLKSGNNQ